MHLQYLQSMAAWLRPAVLDAAVKGAILLGLAAAVSLIFHRASAARRHLLWVFALCATLAMPLLSALLPGWRIGPTLQTATTPATSHVGAAGVQPLNIPLYFNEPAVSDTDATERAAATAPMPPLARASISTTFQIDWWEVAVAVWVLGAIIAMVPVVGGSLVLWRVGRRARRVDCHAWQSQLNAAASQIGISRPIILLQSDERTIPMTWGIARPKILLPVDANAWTPSRRKIVLLHELAHIQRNDCLAQTLAQVARALHWFNPLSWWAVRQVSIERELACDDAVVVGGVRPSEYAEELLAVVTSVKNIFSLPGIAMARSSKIRGRMAAICDPRRNRTALTRRQVALFVLGLCIATVPLSMIAPAMADNGPAAKADAAAIVTDAPAFDTGTFGVARIDMNKLTPSVLKTTLGNLLGKELQPVIDGAMGEFSKLSDGLAAGHVQTVWIGMRRDFTPPTAPRITVYFCFQVEAGADMAAAEKAVRNVASAAGPDIQFQREGHYIMARPGNKPAAAANVDIQTALKHAVSAAGDAPIAVGIVPNDEILDMVGLHETFLRRLSIDTLRMSDAMSLAVNVGESPRIVLRAECRDAARAQRLEKSITDSMNDGREEIAEQKRKGPREEADALDGLSKMIDAAAPKAHENIVEISLDKAALGGIGPMMQARVADARHQASMQASMSRMRQLLIGVIVYTSEHKDQYPDRLDDVKAYIGGDETFKMMMTDPETHANPVFVYEKPADKVSDVKDVTKKAVLFELKNGKKVEYGIVGYADGHVEFVNPPQAH